MSCICENTIVIRSCDKQRFVRWVSMETDHAGPREIIDTGTYAVYVADSNGDFELDSKGEDSCPIGIVLLEANGGDGLWTRAECKEGYLKDTSSTAKELLPEYIGEENCTSIKDRLEYSF